MLIVVNKAGDTLTVHYLRGVWWYIIVISLKGMTIVSEVENEVDDVDKIYNLA